MSTQGLPNKSVKRRIPDDNKQELIRLITTINYSLKNVLPFRFRLPSKLESVTALPRKSTTNSRILYGPRWMIAELSTRRGEVHSLDSLRVREHSIRLKLFLLCQPSEEFMRNPASTDQTICLINLDFGLSTSNRLLLVVAA